MIYSINKWNIEKSTLSCTNAFLKNDYSIPNLWVQLKLMEKELSLVWNLILTYREFVRVFSFVRKFAKIVPKVRTGEKASI